MSTLENFSQLSRDPKVIIGTVAINEVPDLAVFMVNYGKKAPPLSDYLRRNSKIMLEVRRKKSNYVFYVYGNIVHVPVNLNKSLGAIKNGIGDFKQFLSNQEQIPEFSCCSRAGEKAYKLFSNALKKHGLWMLIVSTSINTHLVIQNDSGNILMHYDTRIQSIMTNDLGQHN